MEKVLLESKKGYYALHLDTDSWIFGMSIDVIRDSSNPGIYLDIGIGPLHFLGSLPNKRVWSSRNTFYLVHKLGEALEEGSIFDTTDHRISDRFDRKADYKETLKRLHKLLKIKAIKGMSYHAGSKYVEKYKCAGHTVVLETHPEINVISVAFKSNIYEESQ